MNETRVFYGESNGVGVLKLDGRATYTLGLSLDAFIDKLSSDSQLKGIVVDLSDVSYIDSTILGVLAKIANVANDRWKSKVMLITCNKDIIKILENVGFDDIFIMTGSSTEIEMQLENIEHLDGGKQQNVRLVAEAHRRLMNLNDDNKTEFQDIVTLLEKEAQQS